MLWNSNTKTSANVDPIRSNDQTDSSKAACAHSYRIERYGSYSSRVCIEDGCEDDGSLANLPDEIIIGESARWLDK